MRRLLRTIIPLLALAFVISCGDDSTGPETDPDSDPDPEPTTGMVELTTSTSGEDQDDGYVITLGDQEEDISANETLTFEDLEEDSYEAELTDVADNCSVGGENPRSVEVTAGETTSETFEVNCEVQSQEKIVFASDREGDRDNIFIMNPDGSEVVQLTDSDYNNDEPAISNDGTKIVYNNSSSLKVMNVDGSDKEIIQEYGISQNPDWSTDDSQIVFQNKAGTDDYQICKVSSSGGEMDCLTEGQNPSWSPDGDKIAFQHAGSIKVMDVNGENVEELTNSGDDDESPNWSSDGEKIVFFRQEVGTSIYSVDADGSNLTEVYDDGLDPNWSPDGSTVVFTYLNDIYTVNADGQSESEPILEGDFNVSEPYWSSIKPSNSD